MDMAEIIKIVAGFAIVTILTILTDRWLSNKAAIVVLVGSLVVFAIFSQREISQFLGWARTNKLATIVGCVVLFAAVGFAVGMWVTKEAPSVTPTPIAQAEKLPTLKELFLTDFGPNVNRARWDDRTLTIGSKTNKFPEVTMTFTPQLWIDLHEGIQFLGFYIPIQDKDPDQASKKTVFLCKNLPDQFPAILKMLQSLEVTVPNPRGSAIKSADLPLSRRMYIYHEDFIAPQDLGDLVTAYETRQVLIEFRGSEYLATQQLLRVAGQKK
jgi:hypothetical protein